MYTWTEMKYIAWTRTICFNYCEYDKYMILITPD